MSLQNKIEDKEEMLNLATDISLEERRSILTEIRVLKECRERCESVESCVINKK